MPAYTVLLIRSDGLAWDSVRRALEDAPELDIVRDVRDADQALALAAQFHPNLVVAGATVDSRGVLQLFSAIRERSPDSRFVTIVGRVDEIPPVELLALHGLGLEGQLLWTDLKEGRFQRCLFGVAGDGFVIANHLVAETYVEEIRHRRVSPYELPDLNSDELAVLRGLAEELTLEQIADAEHVSVRTVKGILADLHVKFDTASRFTLAMKATSLGVIP